MMIVPADEQEMEAAVVFRRERSDDWKKHTWVFRKPDVSLPEK